jgi:nucleotide-binding universal stress UspA family protein
MKIMLCFDPTEESYGSLDIAAAHAKAFKGEVLAVASHVIDDKDYPKRIEPTDRKLAKARDMLAAEGICCTTMIAFRGFEDDKGEHLLAIAREQRVDEIIVGVKNRSKVGKVLLGSVAQFLILNAECPVVAVKRALSRIV